jgi:hypothetical protein
MSLGQGTQSSLYTFRENASRKPLHGLKLGKFELAKR